MTLKKKKAETTSLSARSAKLPLLIGAIPALFAAVWVYVDANQLSGLQDLVDATNNIDELSQRILVTPADDVRPEEFQKYALVIRQQLRKDPSDATGWQWLGRLRMSLGQTEEAVAAFDKALKISPDAQDIRMKYAQAMMMVGDDENLQNAKRQVIYLVQIAPENRNYRLLLTVVAAQLNDSDVAFANFALIKDALSADSTVYQSLVNQLRSMGASEELLSLNNGARNGLLDNSLLDNSVVANGTRGFDVTVSIANELESKLPSTGFLILFAQDAISGSRVPLAVKKLALPQFPILLSLSADDAMIASLSLENAEQVTITARISVDEDVMTKPGELEGSLASVTVNDSMQAVTLIINKEI
jgi:cytochrome c-type biogenesis protein CcmH